MAIRYAVDLTDTERTILREILAKNKAKRSTIINAYILLKADRSCGWTNADIALAYEVSTKKVEQLKKRFVEEGFEAALYRKPVTNAHRRKITGDEEAHLIACNRSGGTCYAAIERSSSASGRHGRSDGAGSPVYAAWQASVR